MASWRKAHFMTDMKRRIFSRLMFSEILTFGFLLTFAAFLNTYQLVNELQSEDIPMKVKWAGVKGFNAVWY